MYKPLVSLFTVLSASAGVFASAPASAYASFARTYHEGEALVYRMEGTNQGQHYQALATGEVRKDASGAWFEQYAWSNVVWNGKAIRLPPGSVAFRQILSLDPRKSLSMPNPATVSPALIGPISDLLTFYADLRLATRASALSNPGDHVYIKRGTPASWADGRHVILGEDSIDFDITLSQLDAQREAGTILIRHVPPRSPQVRLPAAWMREPVARTRNNWVEVTHEAGRYVAAVGRETFDVRLVVSLSDGRILSGTLDNPVQTQERVCGDVDLTRCGPARPHQIVRQIKITLMR
jgi:hypothetical protein